MSLEHDFFLIPRGFEMDSWTEWYSRNRFSWGNKTGIDNSLINYISDTLGWIPSYNPETKSPIHGLNYYGETIISDQGAVMLSQIVQRWISLFSVSPEVFKLKSEIVWVEEGEDGGYWQDELVEYRKEFVIDSLRKLLLLSEKAQEGQYFLLHYGI